MSRSRLEKMTKAELVDYVESLMSERSVEAKVLFAISAKESSTTTDSALGELALALARAIDRPAGALDPSPAMPALSKELRGVLLELHTETEGDGVDDELREAVEGGPK